MTWRFFFKRFIPAATAVAVVWIFRDDLDDMMEGSNGSNGS